MFLQLSPGQHPPALGEHFVPCCEQAPGVDCADGGGWLQPQSAVVVLPGKPLPGFLGSYSYAPMSQFEPTGRASLRESRASMGSDLQTALSALSTAGLRSLSAW